MRHALFGGSFNPIHRDHIALARKCIEEFSLDMVTLIPTFHTPLKDNTEIADPAHRLNMCCLAVQGCDDIAVSDVEIARGGVSYTSDTVAALQSDNDELFLIVGADMFMTMDRWHDFRYIFAHAAILVTPRDGLDTSILQRKYEELKVFGCRAYLSRSRVGGLSSTAVRAAVRAGESICDMVDDKVADYITQHGLYR